MKIIHWALLTLLFFVGIIAIVVDGPTTYAALAVLLPVVSLGAVISLIYMIYVYRRLLAPRPIFFRMLLGAVTSKVLLAIPVGYLSILAIGEATGSFHLPMPGDRAQRSAFIALIVCILLSPPMYYALTIWSGRRRAGHSEFDEIVTLTPDPRVEEGHP